MRDRITIIPNETKCVDGIQAEFNDGDIMLCGDCTSVGDRLACPIHHDIIIYIFEAGWWKKYGGSTDSPYDKRPFFKFWCLKCQQYISGNAWSYAG